MGLELRTSLSGLHQQKRKNWKLPSLRVNDDLEAIRKERLHHQPHLVFARIAIRTRLNVKSIRSRPLRK